MKYKRKNRNESFLMPNGWFSGILSVEKIQRKVRPTIQQKKSSCQTLGWLCKNSKKGKSSAFFIFFIFFSSFSFGFCLIPIIELPSQVAQVKIQRIIVFSYAFHGKKAIYFYTLFTKKQIESKKPSLRQKAQSPRSKRILRSHTRIIVSLKMDSVLRNELMN